MQPLKLIIAGLLILFATSLQAQVSVNVNLGIAPPWGPPVQAGIRYYYLPDVEAYYDLRTSMFICFYDGHWVRRHHLPDRFRHYDLYGGPKVIVTDYRGNAPYRYCNYHRHCGMDQYAYGRMAPPPPPRGHYDGFRAGHDGRPGGGREEATMRGRQGNGPNHGDRGGRRD